MNKKVLVFYRLQINLPSYGFFLSPLGGAGLKEYEKPITAVMLACVLSALRLCVWLSNNGYIQLLYMNERFLFTFWTEQGEIP